jgi:hypothetical protein
MNGEPQGHPEGVRGWAPPAEPALVEDVLLLLFQPATGTIVGENTLFYVLAGAVLADLALTQKVEARAAGRWSSRVHAIGTTPPADDLLEPAWAYVAQKPRDAQTVLAAIGPDLREPVLNRLVERGDLTRVTRKVLGVFSSTHLALASTRRPALVKGVRAALVDGEQPGPRTAAVIALLSASGSLAQLHPDIPWSSAVYARGKAFEQGDWGAVAAGSAVTRTVSTIVIGTVIAATS